MASPSKFSGRNGSSAVRWLRSLIHDLPAGLTPGQWLERVDGLLIGDAADWAEQHPDVIKILAEEHLATATAEDVETFKTALKARFAPIEYLSMDMVDLQLLTLKQTPFEGMEAYYERTETLLAALLYASGAMDPVGEVSVDLEQSCLKRVIGVFVHGIRNDAARKQAVAYLSQRITERKDYSLHCVYKQAESLSQPKGTSPETDEKRSSLTQSGNNNLCLRPSQPPALTFTGLFGSIEESHDSYTRSKYGHHCDACVGEPRSLIVSAHGSFTVPRFVANGAWAILGNTPTEAYNDNHPKTRDFSTFGVATPEKSPPETLGELISAAAPKAGSKNATIGSLATGVEAPPLTTPGSENPAKLSNGAAISDPGIFLSATLSISHPPFTPGENINKDNKPAPASAKAAHTVVTVTRPLTIAQKDTSPSALTPQIVCSYPLGIPPSPTPTTLFNSSDSTHDSSTLSSHTPGDSRRTSCSITYPAEGFTDFRGARNSSSASHRVIPNTSRPLINSMTSATKLYSNPNPINHNQSPSPPSSPSLSSAPKQETNNHSHSSNDLTSLRRKASTPSSSPRVKNAILTPSTGETDANAKDHTHTHAHKSMPPPQRTPLFGYTSPLTPSALLGRPTLTGSTDSVSIATATHIFGTASPTFNTNIVTTASSATPSPCTDPPLSPFALLRSPPSANFATVPRRLNPFVRALFGKHAVAGLDRVGGVEVEWMIGVNVVGEGIGKAN